MRATPREPTGGVIYDLDGTLIDSSGNIAAATNAIRDRWGLPPISVAQTVTYIGDGSITLIERALYGQSLGRHPAPPEVLDLRAVPFATVYGAFVEVYLGQGDDGLTLYDGVEETLDELAKRGVPQAILTNKPHEVTLTVCAALGLDRVMARILGPGADVDGSPLPPKPDTTGMEDILSAFAQLGTAREHVWMVGDGPQDIQVASRAGIRSIGIAAGFSEVDELAGLVPPPTHLVSTFRDASRVLGVLPSEP